MMDSFGQVLLGKGLEGGGREQYVQKRSTNSGSGDQNLLPGVFREQKRKQEMRSCSLSSFSVQTGAGSRAKRGRKSKSVLKPLRPHFFRVKSLTQVKVFENFPGFLGSIRGKGAKKNKNGCKGHFWLLNAESDY